ncbi:MAG: hypothetical protein OFPI_06310 [Osedax symbiont Rs2]|nr:MAG: hypothetical protein OFPI_06310 [Osedax symbiont Rs2]
MHRDKGFSLVELMIAISVITLLITVGVPSFSGTVMKLRGSSIADSLITSLHFARSEALSRNERVAVCANTDTDPASANYPCNGTNWNSGWMAVLVSDNSVIKYWPVNSPGAQIALTGMSDELVVYNANGEARINGDSGAFADDQNDAIEFTTQINNCDSPQLSIRRTIDLSSSGLIQVNRGDC